MNYLDVVRELKETRSRNVKINILQQADEDTRNILVAAYDPFTHYFINKVPKYKPASPPALSVCNPIIHRLLTELASRTLSGNTAINEVEYHINRMYADDAEIFKNILRKDLRCGIGVSTINKAIPGLITEFGCMLAKKYDESRYHDDLWMSLKLDGLRTRFRNGKFLTRNGHEIHGLEHLTSEIPSDWELDGELKDPTIHFQETSGDIRSFSAAPNTELFVLDYPIIDTPFNFRYKKYNDMVDVLTHKQIHAVKHIPVKSKKHLNDTFEKALIAGYEGLVIKPRTHLYTPKRSWDWMKLKAEHSEDLPVVGFFEGEGKYEGMLGGVIVERKGGVNVRVGSGFSDAERENIWHDQDNFINQLVEVKYHEETPAGSLRHPVYKGFRYDKNEVN